MNVLRRSNRMKIAAMFMAAISFMPIFSAYLMLFSGESEFYYPELVQVDIHNENPSLKQTIDLAVQVRGLYLLVTSLFWLILALIPFRKGEKWAWFTLAFLGATWIFGYLYLVSVGVLNTIYLASWLYPGIMWLFLWLMGLAFSFREVFKRNSVFDSKR